MLPIDRKRSGAAFVAMPGHKGLLGPQGTGLLLCGMDPEPLLWGGTGSLSQEQTMPDFLPDRAEAGTLNMPGIAGLMAGMAYVSRVGLETIFSRQQTQAARCAAALKRMGHTVFSGEHQSGTVSFLTKADCESVAEALANKGIALRAGLHCAPLAHESGGTLSTGTVRLSFGHDASPGQTAIFLKAMAGL